MKSFFVSILLFISLHTFSQDCTDESLLQTPGTLKADAPYNSGKLSAVDLAKHKKVVATITNMIKSKYAPLGLKALYHENYGYPVANRPANDYGYSIIPLNYYCEGNTFKTAHETSTYFSISANIFDVEIYDTAQGDRLLAEGFNVMHDLPIEKDGIWYFREMDASLGFGMTGKSSAWLITYDGKLPFSYVTKKEFLEKRKRSLSAQMLMSAAAFKDNLKNIEIEKGYKEVEYKNDPEKLKKYMKMDDTDRKLRYEKLLSDNEKNYKSAFNKIDEQLKLPAEELNKQAIVKIDPYDYLSYLFTDDNDAFGKVLIKPNPGYFNKKLPRSSPQFFGYMLEVTIKNP